MNIFDTLRRYGHDEDFEPNAKSRLFMATSGSPGSIEKIEAMRYRVEVGCPLWHPDDPKNADIATKIQHGKTGVANPIKQVVCASFQRRKAPAE